MEKDYYTKIDDYNLLEPGDVLWIPPEARALHVSPQTLARHGLSVGTGCRKLNSIVLASRIFTKTRDSGCMLMVSKRQTRIPEPPDEAIVNAIPDNLSHRPLDSFSAYVLDESHLPTAPGGSDPHTSVILTVQPLADAVTRELSKTMTEPMWSKFNSDWGVLDKIRWYDLDSCSCPASRILTLSPEKKTSPMGSATLLDCIFRVRKYGRGFRERDVMLNVKSPAFIEYLFSHGAEIHRPRPKLWTLLAKRVLAQYARELVADAAEMDLALNQFVQRLRGELREFAKFRKSWSAAAAKYGKEVACH